MKVVRLLLLACASLLLLACSQQELIDKFTPKAESAYAQKLFADLRAGHYDTVKDALAPALRTPDIDKKLAEVAAPFPAGEPKAVHVVGANTSTLSMNGGPATTKYNLTYEYQFADSWVLANVVLQRDKDGLRVLGLHTESRARSLEATSGFSLAGKGVQYLAFLALVIAIPFFCIYAFVMCLRTPNLERRWLWALFTLFGFVAVGLNWNSGELSFHPIYFLLLGAGVSQGGFGPWVLNIAFPLGAVWFLWKRRTLLKAAAL
ncbi:hypothetical protein [Dyella sp. 2RAB6]|uniref:hypothetical protein n=1 Tax=Dyella sp. 2RAB6 TaxID=3232992 RepID=UPI003F9303F5